MFYNSSRYFQFWIYSVSHSVLIIRCSNSSEDESESFNIDIEFWGVSYIDSSDYFKGLSISVLLKDFPEKFKEISNKHFGSVFQIISDTKKYYIVASGCRVGINRWEIENRVINPELEYDEVIVDLTTYSK